MRIKIAFFAGLLCILAAGIMALPAPAAAQEQCFICNTLAGGLLHQDGCEVSYYRQDYPEEIHNGCANDAWGSCIAVHTRCAWVMEGYSEETGTLLARSECGSDLTSITLT